MTGFRKYAEYLRGNPVVLLDLMKYAAVVAVLFGLPIPPGVDVAVAGAVLAVLTIITRSRVVEVGKHTREVEDALATPVPTQDESGESAYLREIGA
ncbi:hypothetical protein PSH03_005401 [Micromonospora sp. PSH03]|uniref:hypothetical protein n=1 Tax=Micromonospora salmantinae TaxID=2911211 RepID=UPI001EE7AF52|nr:hypothetical protein [Micromonospora salmantinae]MCG5459617.1 hypothetical protein [Micromonospora salmantinae]